MRWSIWAVELGSWLYIVVLLTAAAVAFLGLTVYVATGSSVMLVLGAITLIWVTLQMFSFLCLQLCVSGGGACCKLFLHLYN